jgi:hypothetical protein
MAWDDDHEVAQASSWAMSPILVLGQMGKVEAETSLPR